MTKIEYTKQVLEAVRLLSSGEFTPSEIKELVPAEVYDEAVAMFYIIRDGKSS